MAEEEKMAELEGRFNKAEDTELRGETWVPNIGDVLVGTVVARRELTIGDRRCQLVVIKTKAGELKTVWWTTVLKEFFDQVKIDNVVAIKYLGERRGKKGGRPYKVYKWEIA